MKISTKFLISLVIQSLKLSKRTNRRELVLLPLWVGGLLVLPFCMNPGSCSAQIPIQTSVLSSIPGDVVSVVKLADTSAEPSHILGTPAELNEDGLCESGFITFELQDGVPLSLQLPMSYAASLINQWVNLVDTVRIACSFNVAAPNNLGSAGPSQWYEIEGLPGFYPSALAKQIAIGVDNDLDISMNINSGFPNWYLGIDGNCPAGQVDMVTIMLHEILHGFGFVNLSGIGSDGEPVVNVGFSVWEYHLADIDGNMIWSVDFGVDEAWAMYTDSSLYFAGPEVNANLDALPMLFAPDPYQSGSSISHLDEGTYLGNNELMTPSAAPGQALHTPGNIGMWMLADLGYDINYNPGCTDPSACNYDASASFNDGTCSFDPPVCMNPAGCNYDPTGVCHDPAACTQPPVIYLPNDSDTGLTTYMPCDAGSSPPEGYHPAYDQAAAWEVIMSDFGCAEEWTPECHSFYALLACGMSLYDQANNQPVTLDLSDQIFDDPLVVYCEDYYVGIEEDIVQEIIDAIDIIDECPESVLVNGFHEYTYNCGPKAGGMNVFLYFIDIMGEVTPWTGFVNILDVVAPSITLPPPTSWNASDNVYGYLGFPSYPFDENDVVEFLTNVFLPSTVISDNCTPYQQLDEFISVEINYLGAVISDGTALAQFTIVATDACGNASSNLAYAYNLYDQNCGWYLPNELEGGPAVFSCEPVDGYTWATNQTCAEETTGLIDFCTEETWDGYCQNYYAICSTGCTDATACNYDEDASEDDGSCEYLAWVIPEDSDANLLPLQWCPSSPMPVGYVMANQSCVESVILNDDYCDGTAWDGICQAAYEDCLNLQPGCMLEAACNYDPDAGVGNASCLYPGDACADSTDCETAGVFSINCECISTIIDSDGDGICDGEEIEGCTNALALNYDPEATDDDGSCWIEGCKEAEACNFDPEANLDDGSCIFPGDLCVMPSECNSEGYYDENCTCMFDGPGDTDGDGVCDDAEVPGCTNDSAVNYDPEATDDDGSCSIEGCKEAEACNFDPEANLDDGSCTFPGDFCMEATACNSEGFIDADCNCVFEGPGDANGDGVCDYACPTYAFTGCMDEAALNYNSLATLPATCMYAEVNGCMDASACNYNSEATFDGGGCMYPAADYLDCSGECLNDFDGDGVCDELAIYGCMDSAALNYNPYATNSNDVGSICVYAYVSGCMNESACNYNSEATFDGGGCMYPAADYLDCSGECLNDFDGDGVCDELAIYGCMDSAALNYNPYATNSNDEGSICVYAYVSGCMNESACNYNSEATFDNGSCYYAVTEYADCDGSCISDADGDGVCDELEVPGCTNPDAINFDVSATDENGSCLVPTSMGCTYSIATNYDAGADYDDGTCLFDSSDSNLCPNDIDGDGNVAVSDLLLLLSSYGTTCE